MANLRVQKLYHRLEELEADFASKLRSEFAREIDGHSSHYLSRKIPHLFDGRRYKTSETSALERSEVEIARLREKLGESLSSGPLSILQKYVDGRRRMMREGREIAWAKQALDDLISLDLGSKCK
jgi:hypothetical protein